MTKRLIALVILLAVPVLSVGQSMSRGVVQNRDGKLVSGAPIRICQSPANATPCTNYATIYADKAMTIPIAQPGVPGFTTDSLGNYRYYTAESAVDEQIQVGGTWVNYAGIIPQGGSAVSVTSKKWSTTPPDIWQSAFRVNADAYRGGVLTYNGVSGTKTQFASQWLQSMYRTLGERKDFTQYMYCLGKGDCIGVASFVHDYGGYGAPGDEGHAGMRLDVQQGNGVPIGTVSAVNSAKVTATWNTGTAALLGEKRPLIVTTSHAPYPYSTGTLTSATSTSPCIITGNGTSWTSLTAGDHSDLFMEITPFNSSGGLKYVVPVTHITDDTHLTIEYTLSEFADTCIGASLTGGSSYVIYRGAIVNSLDDPVSGTDPSTVNTAITASMFQAGDVVQQPLGYNLRSAGFNVFVNQLVGPGQGYGGEIYNTSERIVLESGLRIFGKWYYGVRFGGDLSTAMLYSSAKVPAYIHNVDRTQPSSNLFQLANSAGAARNITYDRTNDRFYTTNGFYVDGPTSHISQGTVPQPTVNYWIQWTDVTHEGIRINAPAALGAGKYTIWAGRNGVTDFGCSPSYCDIGNNNTLRGYSDNYLTKTWQVTGAGAAQFTGVQPGATGGSITWFQKITHAALDLASVATAACSAETTETITGAALGDSCTVTSGTALEAGGFMRCAVTGVDTVKWQLCNLSGGNIDRAADTYTIRVLR